MLDLPGALIVSVGCLPARTQLTETMRLKNKNSTPAGGFVFYYKDSATKKEIRVPAGNRSANGLKQLSGMVTLAFKNNGMNIPKNLVELIEHQICLRQKDPTKVCFSGGIGDTLHHKVAKPMTRAIAKAAKKLHAPKVAKAVTRVGGCSGCSGTKTYVQGKRNLGRAGLLNKLTPKHKLNSKKFALNAEYKER